MKYKIYITEVCTYTTEIEASSRSEADEKAEQIAEALTPSELIHGDTYVEVEEIK